MTPTRNPRMPGIPKIQWQISVPVLAQKTIHALQITDALNTLAAAFQVVAKSNPRHSTPYMLSADCDGKNLVLTVWWMGLPATADRLHRISPAFTKLTPAEFDRATAEVPAPLPAVDEPAAEEEEKGK